ncbi:MAG: CHAT domain-containing protein [Cyanobacteria bacterium P01_G01_bin.38]
MGRTYWLLSSLCLLELVVFQQQLKAQVTPTADATGTTVDINSNQFDISGGTRVGDNLFHRFDALNLSTDQIANFLSDPSVQLILSQISGGDTSYIDGLLQVSGSGADLYLLNPSGILFGPNARLDLSGSFTAATADRLRFNGGDLDVLGTTDYAHLVDTPHSLVFSSGNPGSLINQGQLSVSTGQSLRLAGGHVLNTGILTAPGGEITLAAVPGESQIRISQANQLISLDLATAPTSTTPDIDDRLAPATLPELLTGGQQSGATQLVTNADGSIALTSDDIKPLSGVAIASGQLDTTSETGGQINILGQHVGILNADVNASGNHGGGTIRIGGDSRGQGTVPNATTTVVDALSIIQADARDTGNGGHITVWADHTARFSGTASARGGATSGNGGHIETSGQDYLDITGSSVDASTPNGDAGLWLLDPTDIDIVDGAGGSPTAGLFAPATTGIASQISPDTIEAALDSGTSVEITTTNGSGGNGDITLIDSINQTGGGNAALTLTGRRFTQNGSTDEIHLTSTGGLTFNLNQVNPEANPTTASIQHAIDAIGDVAGDRTINLGAGTYLTNGTPVTIDRDVAIAGENRNTTILSGSNTSRIFEVTNAATTTLQDLTITAGTTPTDEAGGGVYSTGNLTLLNTHFDNNHAQRRGGAVFLGGTGNTSAIIDSTFSNNSTYGGIIQDNDGGAVSIGGQNNTVNIVDSLFINNHANDDGGALENRQSTSSPGPVSILRSQFINNTAGDEGGSLRNDGYLSLTDSLLSNNTAGDRGGGIYNIGDITIANSTFEQNQAHGSGGGLFNHGNLSATNSTLRGNQALNSGGIDNAGGTLSLLNSQVTNNTTSETANLGNDSIFVSQGGGGLRNRDGGTLTIHQSEVSGNTSSVLGGGILNAANDNITTTRITDSTIANNSAGLRGGGIQASINGGGEETSVLEITNSTLSGNQAGELGGGIRTVGDTRLTNVTITDNSVVNGTGGGISAETTSATTTLTNSLVADNQAAVSPDVAGDFDDQGNNLIGISDGSTGFSQSTLVGDMTAPINPQLAPLGNYGGNTSTHALLPDSEAIDAGNNSAVPAVDQRGVTRSDGSADIGAFESTGYRLQTTGGTGQRTEVETAFDAPLQVSLTENAFNTPLPGANIDFVAPQTGASATPDQVQTVTDVNGQATVSVTANASSGNYSVTASTGNLTTQLDLTNVASPAVSSPDTMPHPDEAIPSQMSSPAALTATNPAWQFVMQQPEAGLDEAEAGMTVKLSTNTAADLALQEFDRSLSTDYGDYYDGLNAGGASITEIQQTLKRVRNERAKKSAIVYAIFTPKDETRSAYPDLVSASLDTLERPDEAKPDDQLELILITETEDPIRYVTNATRAEVIELAKYYRMAVSDPEDFRSFQALSQQFYQWLLNPLEADLQRQAITSLVYTLDEGLRTIPLAAMMDRDGYVINRYGLSIIPSFGLTERSLVWLKDQTTLATGSETFQTMEPLPAVEAELAWVQSQLGGGTSLINEDFTLDNLIKAQNSHNPGVLHVATHAQFNPGQPQDSFIQFWDEQLSLDEVRSLNWQNSSLELLILSACTTAVGDRNAELGFAGIATASGVRSALGSLWFISDIGTVALMGEFYAQLETSQTITEALQKTQQALISGQVKLENGNLITSAGAIPMPNELDLPDSFIFNHPYYWSAFTLIGNPW